MTCRISSFQNDGYLQLHYYFLAEGIWKVHIHVFRHLFVCFQTSVYTLGEFHKNRNNSTVFEELEVSIVDLMVANTRFTGSANCYSLISIRYIHIYFYQILTAFKQLKIMDQWIHWIKLSRSESLKFDNYQRFINRFVGLSD
jgi:hypothetical protein